MGPHREYATDGNRHNGYAIVVAKEKPAKENERKRAKAQYDVSLRLELTFKRA